MSACNNFDLGEAFDASLDNSFQQNRNMPRAESSLGMKCLITILFMDNYDNNIING